MAKNTAPPAIVTEAADQSESAIVAELTALAAPGWTSGWRGTVTTRTSVRMRSDVCSMSGRQMGTRTVLEGRIPTSITFAVFHIINFYYVKNCGAVTHHQKELSDMGRQNVMKSWNISKVPNYRGPGHTEVLDTMKWIVQQSLFDQITHHLNHEIMKKLQKNVILVGTLPLNLSLVGSRRCEIMSITRAILMIIFRVLTLPLFPCLENTG